MATNVYFSQKVKSEQTLYEDIVIESLKMYGQDVYYLPRDIVNKDMILNDDVPSKFNSSYKIEMYIENVEGYGGDGDLLTKFGVELRDNVTFIVARKRWRQTVGRYDNEINSERPREGDLVYIPLSNTMFEIMHVEHEQPFYQLSNLPTYKLKCEKFEYSDERIDTGLPFIDNIENTGYLTKLTLTDSADNGFIIGSVVTQALPSGVVVTAEIVDYNDSSNVISLAHIGSNDVTGQLHEFVQGVAITSTDSAGATIIRTVTQTNEQLNQVGAQNQVFTDEVDFIDFSEENPFGDIEVL